MTRSETTAVGLPLRLGEGWGEGLRSLMQDDPLTRIALDDAAASRGAFRPLPMGEVNCFAACSIKPNLFVR